MTLQEFYKLLEKYGKGKFKITNSGIRYTTKQGNTCCPIEYVYGRLKHKSLDSCARKYYNQWQFLGLSIDDRNAIMEGADSVHGSKPITNQLKQVLGL